MHKKLQKGKKQHISCNTWEFVRCMCSTKNINAPKWEKKENTQKHAHRCPAPKKEGAGVVLGVKNKKSLFLATPHPAAGGVLKVRSFFGGVQSFLFLLGNPSASSRISKCCWLRNHPPSDFNAKDIFCFASLNIRSPPAAAHFPHTKDYELERQQNSQKQETGGES